MAPVALETSSQLLFGIIALQHDFITREQLVEAFSQWVKDKSRPIDQILAQDGRLSKEEGQAIGLLVKKHLAKHQGDPAISLTLLDSPKLSEVRDKLSQLGDQEIQASLQPRATMDTQIYTDEEIEYATDRSKAGRYSVIRPYAKGGLGEVFLAFDQELMREVALKEIQPRFADDRGSRGRFMLEAEITGSLEHPGIVPVYGMGLHTDGRPYYAMRLIRGHSMKDGVDKFFQDSDVSMGRKAGMQSVAWRQLLGYFVAVCHAIEYAHSRGVLHRDIKPANIMIGKFGEALVVDWGLAKVRGRADSNFRTDETTLKPISGDSSDTREGSAIGTPAFMSPEQAMGQLDEIRPASDIYSLGATLYYILTGHPPFSSDNVANTLQKAIRGEFPIPRKVRPTVSRSLEAVCLKAMALDPQNRYPTARDLASDLELWLADEPVSAYGGSVSERFGRWMRRHRGIVQLTAVGLAFVTLLSVFAAFAFQKLRAEAEIERHNAIVAKQAADTARSNAEQLASDNRELAKQEEAARTAAQELAKSNAELALKESAGRELAEDFANKMKIEAEKSSRLSDFLIRTFQASDPIGQGAAPGFLPKEKGGELTAREMLDLGADRLADDKELSEYPLTKAAIMEAIGDAYRQLGLFTNAEPLLTEALEIRRDLLPANHPDLASSLQNLGWYYHERGNYPIATVMYDEALQIRRLMPDDEGLRLVSNTLHNKAWMLANEGWGEEAESLAREAFAIRRKVLGERHRDTIFSHLALCFVLIEQDKFVEAAVQLGLVRSNFSVVKTDPNVAEAATEFAWGVINRELQGLAASEQHLRKALAAGDAGLGKDNVYVAVILCELATTLEGMHKDDEALMLYERCLKIARDRVSLEHPRIAIPVSRYADLLVKKKRTQEAREIWSDFMEAQYRKFDERYGQVVRSRVGQARFLRSIRDYSEADKLLEDVVRIIRQVAVEGSGYRYHPGLLGDALNQQALCLLDSKLDLKRAVQLLSESVQAYREEQLPEKAAAELIGWPLANLISANVAVGELTAARKSLEESRVNLKAMRGSDRKIHLENQLEKAIELHLAERNVDDLRTVAVQLLPLLKASSSSSKPTDLMKLCNSLCRAAKMVEMKDQPSGKSDGATAIRQELIDLAMDCLLQATQAGYDPNRIPNWSDTELLKEFDAYKKLPIPNTSSDSQPSK